MASAYPLGGPDLRARGASLERRLKGLLNNDLKEICRNERLQVSGLKAQLQERIINRINQLVANSDEHTLNRIEYQIKNHGTLPPSGTPTFINTSPTTSHAPRMSNGYSMGPAHGSQSRAPGVPHAKVKWKDTPFFKIIEPLTSTMELPKLEGHRQQVHLKVVVPDRLLEPLRTDSKLRLMLYSASEPLLGHNFGNADVSFPQNMEVKVNGVEDVKWNHKGLKNKPGSAQPGDVTSFIRKLPNYQNDIGIMYALTGRKFYMNVMLVRRSNPEELTNKLKARPTISKSRVIREMQAKANDPDIEATSTNMSLKDPISMLRMTIPCRSNVCTHNQCFDAFTFLDMQQQGPTWSCPICSKSVQYEGLAIDEYVQDILQKMPQSVDQVTLEPNGDWKPFVESPERRNGFGNSHDDDDDDDLVEISDYRPAGLKVESPVTPFGLQPTPPLPSPALGSGHRASGGVSSKRKSEVIDLTLSDDDDAPAPKRPALTPAASVTSNHTPTRNGFRQPNGAPSSMKPNGPVSYSVNSESGSRPAFSSFQMPQSSSSRPNSYDQSNQANYYRGSSSASFGS